MTHINIKISKAVATAEKDGIITAGMVGVPVSFMFDSWWDGLIVTAVFKGSGAPISVPLLGATETVVPWEVLKRPNTLLRIGAEGRLPDGTLVIPTTWSTVGIVMSGANATDDLAKPPTPTAFDRIMSQIGSMNDLATEDKSSLVAAVNEAMEKGGVDVSGASVGQIIKVAAVDDAGKPTAWEPADLPEQAQSDWDQNDAEQPNYVKNRPFYEKIDSVTLMPETQFSNLTYKPNPEISIPSDVNGEYIGNFTDGEIFEGDPVKVTFNGTVYECVKKDYYIGNQSLTSYDGVEDTGEPFLFYLGGISSFHTKSTDCVVKVDADISSIKKLDSKFIDFPFIEGTGADSIIFNSIDKTSGYMNEASGKGSFASGYLTEATGEYSHVEGEHSEATGKSSHAEGFGAKANGKFSHAECRNTEANGSDSHAEGNGTVANGECQHSQGKYNIIDTDGKYLHIVGNGRDISNRSNAHTLDWSGNAWFAGEVKVGGTGQDDIAAKTLAMTEDIPVVDGTLTQSGQAADAKAVGDAINSFSEEIVTTSESKVAAHNTGTDTHSDIRLLIQGLTDRLNALADSDDTTLDQLSEIVAYIKSNSDLIDAVTTSKVSVTDIVNDLATNVSNKPLSASQGVALKALIDAITIPTALPNPNALTFTGSVTGSYDGSVPMTVEIPAGGGSSGGSGKAKSQILIDQEITELTASLSVTLEHDFHNLTAIISCGSDGAALTAGSDGTAVASKIGLMIDTTSFGYNSRKVSYVDTSTTTWQTRMIGAEWSDDLSVFKRGFKVDIATGTSAKYYDFPFGGTSAMYGTLGTDDNAPRTGKTANIVVNGAYLNVGTRVVLWGEYYE